MSLDYVVAREEGSFGSGRKKKGENGGHGIK